MNIIALERVKYVPRELKPSILYVSDEYAVACHLCACGCGSKVTTPLGPAEWTFMERNGRPTLYPSIGNWQLPCQSHYLITDGRVQWAPQWSGAQIETGRRRENQLRQAYYASVDKRRGFWRRLWLCVRQVLKL